MNNNKDGGEKKGEFRIDEMFSEIYETETINVQDGSNLLQDGLSKEEKGRILKMTIEKIGVDCASREDQTESRLEELSSIQDKSDNRVSITTRRKKRRILTVALIAVFAFATTAFAAEIFQWDNRISNYFGIGEQNSAGLSGSGMNVGVSDENNGWIIEAVQTIGDANNMYILLDVTAPEGQIIYPESSFDMIYLKVDGVTRMGYSCDMLADDNENDNKATFLFSMDADKKINDKTMNLKFNNLRHYIIGSGEMIPDCEGDWELEWKLDYEDISTKYSVGKDLTVNGETVKVDSVSVSPIALNVQISGSYIKKYDSQPPESETGQLVEITAITLKDGTVLTQEDSFSGGTSTRDSEYVINMQMKDLLEVDQVKSITLNDTEFVL